MLYGAEYVFKYVQRSDLNVMEENMYQLRPVSEIIGKEEAESLHDEVWDALGDGCSYDDIEEIMAGYGLEMDYIEQLI